MCILHCKAPQTIRFTAMVNTSDYFVPFIIIVSFIIVLYLYFMNQVLSSGMRRTCHAPVQLGILSEAWTTHPTTDIPLLLRSWTSDAHWVYFIEQKCFVLKNS